MTIVLTGGGSGGHITPLLAVAAELKQHQPKARLVYVGQVGDRFGDLAESDAHFDAVYRVRAGKFRRYHGEGLAQLLDVKTMALNLRDVCFVVMGLWQSWRLMRQLQPTIVFSRGGFVSVPVCLGAALNRVRYITHDSDRVPSLANRIIARWAARHAVAFPPEAYPYPADRTVQTGIPLRKEFAPVTPSQKQHFRRDMGIPAQAKLLFVIGGGLGSQRINQAVSEAIPHVMHEHQDLHVVHIVGKVHEATVRAVYEQALRPEEQGRLQVFGFTHDVYRYSGAADLIITRAGATNLAEFAVQGKACIVVPSGFLSGGHQLENARYLAEEGAIEVLDEAAMIADSNRLARLVSGLLAEPKRQHVLAQKLQSFGQPSAATIIAELIVHEAEL